MMEILRLFMFAWKLLAVALGAGSARDAAIAYRFEIATACFNATEDRTERYVCMKIPRFESNYREDVGRCAIKGAAGEVTAWQILPRGAADAARLCRSLDEDAVVAVERIRESRKACAHLPPSEQLGTYARGRCDSADGKRLSRHRWPYEQEIPK